MQVSVSRIPFVLSSYAFAQPLWETAPHNTTKQLGKDRLSSQETEKHTEQTIKVHIWSYPIHPCPKPFPLPSGAQLTPPVSCNHPPCTESCPSSPGLEIPAVHRASHQVSSMCRHSGQRPGGGGQEEVAAAFLMSRQKHLQPQHWKQCSSCYKG